ncbi:MAG TPA: tyrosine-type recombinase/integrase [Verrucomicrobiae bacterium]|nr:tyrosine-type recombinase/integrase [Verrucomicrobiae bacterium]
MIAKRRVRKHVLKAVRYKHHPTLEWTVTGYYLNGKRVRRFFATEEEANTFIQQQTTKRENLGARALAIPHELHVEAIDCTDKLKPWGQSLTDATEFYIRHLEVASRSCTADELLPRFLKAKEADGGGVRYLRDLRTRLGRFSHDCGSVLLSAITPGKLDDWLRGLSLSPQSRINFRRVLHVFFEFARKAGHVEVNPVTETIKPRRAAGEVAIFTPAEAKALLDTAAARDPEIIPFFAIGLFAGLRVAELERLDWADVRLDRTFIEVKASASKTASRRLVKIEPNLAEWLTPHAKLSGSVVLPNLRKRREAVRLAAGLAKWPDNGMRHSFGSYHLAHFQDAARTALEMGHRDTQMIFGHYREVVTPEDAAAYWIIRPTIGS